MYFLCLLHFDKSNAYEITWLKLEHTSPKIRFVAYIVFGVALDLLYHKKLGIPNMG